MDTAQAGLFHIRMAVASDRACPSGRAKPQLRPGEPVVGQEAWRYDESRCCPRRRAGGWQGMCQEEESAAGLITTPQGRMSLALLPRPRWSRYRCSSARSAPNCMNT